MSDDVHDLRMTEPPTIHPKTTKTLIYSRETTRSYVVKLSRPSSVSLVIKVFAITKSHTRPSQASNELLEDHEVEIRYLSLFSDELMDKGIFEGCIIPVSYMKLDRAKVEESGYLDKKKMFFEKKRSTNMYAIIIAEAADDSVCHELTKLVRSIPNGVSEVNYKLSAIFFQFVFMLAAIHHKFPGFRHNDLHCANILVQYIDVPELRRRLGLANHESLVTEYSFGNLRWQVSLDRAPFRLLLWDLSYSSIGCRSAIYYKLQRVIPRIRECGSLAVVSKTRPHQYTDTHKFIDSCRWMMHGSTSVGNLNKLDPMLLKFLDQDVVPPELRCSELGIEQKQEERHRRQKVFNMAHPTTPTQLLKTHQLFHSMFGVKINEKRHKPVARFVIPVS